MQSSVPICKFTPHSPGFNFSIVDSDIPSFKAMLSQESPAATL